MGFGIVSGAGRATGAGGSNKIFRTVGEMSPGEIVKLPENGQLVDFYIVCHDYLSSLNGTGATLIVRKEGYNKQAWGTASSSGYYDYENNSIDTYLNSDYYNLFNDTIKNLINITMITCNKGDDTSSTKTISRKIFILALQNFGIWNSFNNILYREPQSFAGYKLAYCVTNSKFDTQWTRTIATQGKPYFISSPMYFGGDAVSDTANTLRGVRPAFTISSTLVTNFNGTIIIS